MTDLFEKSMETLELPRVLSLLADQAVTEEGKERARRLRPGRPRSTGRATGRRKAPLTSSSIPCTPTGFWRTRSPAPL